MLCKIADLLVEIPETENMVSRCEKYAVCSEAKPDIVLKKELYKLSNYPNLSEQDAIYMESGGQFYSRLLLLGGLMLHSSALEYEGRAYLFSGPSGMGKSTHTGMWRKAFGESVRTLNDDKPALRCIDGTWYAYGTPWCGKDGININSKAPIAGICFLKRGSENEIRRLSEFEATGAIMSQTLGALNEKMLSLVLNLVENVVNDIPVYELKCLPDVAAAQLAYATMKADVSESEK